MEGLGTLKAGEGENPPTSKTPRKPLADADALRKALLQRGRGQTWVELLRIWGTVQL